MFWRFPWESLSTFPCWISCQGIKSVFWTCIKEREVNSAEVCLGKLGLSNRLSLKNSMTTHKKRYHFNEDKLKRMRQIKYWLIYPMHLPSIMLCQLYVCKPAKLEKRKKDKKLTTSWSHREIIWTPRCVSDIFEFQKNQEVNWFRLDCLEFFHISGLNTVV